MFIVRVFFFFSLFNIGFFCGVFFFFKSFGVLTAFNFQGAVLFIQRVPPQVHHACSGGGYSVRMQDKDTEKTQRSSREPVKAEKSHLGIFFFPPPPLLSNAGRDSEWMMTV